MNYRPISLTCIASKTLEQIVHSHVMKHLEHYAFLTDVQHGFRALKTIQDDKSVHAGVLDFSEALFDKVPHVRLLSMCYSIMVFVVSCLTGLNLSSRTALGQSSVMTNVLTLGRCHLESRKVQF